MKQSNRGDKHAAVPECAVPRRRPVVEEIEPRILYSADFAPAVLDPHAVLPAAEHRVVDAAGDFVNQSVAAPDAVRHEVVFVDTSVPDYQSRYRRYQADHSDTGGDA
jgi:hypothetical protein